MPKMQLDNRAGHERFGMDDMKNVLLFCKDFMNVARYRYLFCTVPQSVT